MKSLPSDLSKTSMPVQWNQAPRKVVQPAAVKDIKFVKASHGARDKLLVEALDPEADFDPRDPDERVLMKMPKTPCSEVCNLVTLKVELNNSGCRHSIPLQHLVRQIQHPPRSSPPRRDCGRRSFFVMIMPKRSVVYLYIDLILIAVSVGMFCCL